MRILFITPSLEVGRDGVADYTWLLAKECQIQGHTCAILSWNDSFLEIVEDVRHLEREGIPILRMSSYLQLSRKEDIARTFIETQLPDWVSVQMVSFGFHPRGFVFALGTSLRKCIPASAKVQVMFHELWLGLATNHPWKEKAYGVLQKMALLKFRKVLKPSLVHVSNAIYYAKLIRFEMPVHYLPLPSNIEVDTSSDQEWIFTSLSLANKRRETAFVLLFFGTLHAGWDIDKFWQHIRSLAGEKELYVVSAGGQGNGKALWERMVEQQKSHIQFVKLGFLSDTQLSSLLQFVDAGLSTTPLSLLGKSGSAMAMIEHGLPIIATRNELRFSFPIQDIEDHYPHVYMWNELESLAQLKKSPLRINRINQIAAKFLKDITLCF